MSASQAASALERMYEDTTVRDELIDQDATILLQWGEAQVNKLAQQEMADGQFEDAFYKLTKVMARINRFVGKRQDADETKLADLLKRFADVAAEAGYTITPDKLDAFAKAHAALDNAAAVRAMTALLAGENAAPQQQTAADQPAPQAPAAPISTPEQSDAPQQPAASPAAPTEPPAPKPTSPLDNVINWIRSSEGKE